MQRLQMPVVHISERDVIPSPPREEIAAWIKDHPETQRFIDGFIARSVAQFPASNRNEEARAATRRLAEWACYAKAHATEKPVESPW